MGKFHHSNGLSACAFNNNTDTKKKPTSLRRAKWAETGRSDGVASHVRGYGHRWHVLLGDDGGLWPSDTAPVAIRARESWRVLLGEDGGLRPSNNAPVAIRARESWHVLLGEDGGLWPPDTAAVAVVASESTRRSRLGHGRGRLTGREGVVVERGQRFPVISIRTGPKGNGEDTEGKKEIDVWTKASRDAPRTDE